MRRFEQLLVSVEDARAMLGNIGRTNLYAMLSRGELESRKLGKRRLVLVASIRRLIDSAQD
ncbi:helix-turn-helix domain-containing protein [Tsuneonella troitsensis]|uniref:helix-turn-helix domain-containing protein n=1 Tax=Tsuneonella troitsensis TaxID=292222 RepID=UPI00070A4495|nr:helix-turn-helix domain-containing protein [Tsuneonella troitsensis]